MAHFNRREFVFRIVLLGVSVGIAILIMLYWLIVSFSAESFTFRLIGELHRMIPGVYLVDALPLMLGTMFWIIARKRAIQFSVLQKQISEEAGKKDKIKIFTNNLIAEKFKSEIDFTDQDRDLSDTLMKLLKKLKQNIVSEKVRRVDERQRNYVSEGLAEFGDILRMHANNLEGLTSAIIAGLVRYMELNQGGFFLIDQEKGRKIIRMTACYAYDRNKFPDRIIEWGEGLIGSVVLEKKSIYTDKIPDSYLTVTSGLGKANPKYLLIAPLIFHDEVYGIIELASFKAIDPYKINFVERVAESTATTISTMESNIRTERLLSETQAQAEQLSKQEEQVRQNMEALKKTQDEAARQAEKFISFTNTVNHTLIRAEYNTDGKLLYANTKFLKKLGYSGNKEVEGKHISMFINDKDMDWFNGIWGELSKGGKHFEGYMKHETKLGQDLWTMATYTCERKDDGTVDKIQFIAIDTTEQKKQSLDFEGEIEAINRLSPKAEFHTDGKLKNCNELFESTFKYTQQELSQLNVFDFVSHADQEQFTEIWERVIKGDAFQGQIQMKTRYEEDIWFRAAFTSIDDMYGDVEKVIFLANEITKEKEMELEQRKQHEKLVKKEEELKISGLDLQRKLDALKKAGKLEKTNLENEIKLYENMLEQMPYPILSINNTGFLLFMNNEAEKTLGFRKKKSIGMKVSELFSIGENSKAVESFIHPSKSKQTGTHKKQTLVTKGLKRIDTDLIITKTELGDEIHYTMVLKPAP